MRLAPNSLIVSITMTTIRSAFYLLLLLLVGCVYRVAYFSPQQITTDDHPQREVIFIYRGSTSFQVHTQENKNNTWILVSVESARGSLTVPTKGFYIISNSKKYLPVATPRILKKELSPGNDHISLGKNEILVVEFGKGIQSLDTFTLFLPEITSGDGNIIENITEIAFSRKREWRAFSIN